MQCGFTGSEDIQKTLNLIGRAFVFCIQNVQFAWITNQLLYQLSYTSIRSYRFQRIMYYNKLI